MNRRQFLQSGRALGLLPLLGHAPYPQWNVYRKRNLFILASRTDAPSYALGKAIAHTLATHLPTSRAHVARTPDMDRIASLLATEQVEVAVLPVEIAALMLAGTPPFERYGAIPLTTLQQLGHYLLVAHAHMPAHHAYQVVQALAEYPLTDAAMAIATAPEANADAPPESIPAFHPGAIAYMQHQSQAEAPA